MLSENRDVNGMTDEAYDAYCESEAAALWEKLLECPVESESERKEKIEVKRVQNPENNLHELRKTMFESFVNGVGGNCYYPVEESPGETIWRVESGKHDPNDKYAELRLRIPRQVYLARTEKITTMLKRLTREMKICRVHVVIDQKERFVKVEFVNNHYSSSKGIVKWVLWKEHDVDIVIKELKEVFPRTLRL